MTAWYNEIDPYAAQWLRNLIGEGLIAPGDVDERDIRDVRPSDLDGYTQCHFFAGIGGWSLALRFAGWPDDRPVWTGSCPCQPFSAAGGRAGFADERHLWPFWHWLIQECRPPVVFGEQVASGPAKDWLDLVSADLEGLGYAFGAASVPACGVGAPQLRQRAWFVGALADSANPGRSELPGWHDQTDGRSTSEFGRLRNADPLARSDRPGLGLQPERDGQPFAGQDGQSRPDGAGRSDAGELADPSEQRQHRIDQTLGQNGRRQLKTDCGISGRPGPLHGVWRAADWLLCRDGKWRPVEPGAQQMADGFSESLGRVRPEIVAQIEKEIADANAGEESVREALRDLWLAYAEEAIQRPPGGCLSLQGAPVLLAFLRELKGEGWQFLDHLPSACWEDAQRGVRALREAAPAPSRSSSGREPGEQRSDEPRDVVSVVSQAIARAVSDAWTMPGPLADNAFCRVQRLRCYGNAIVPQVAAEFIRAADVPQSSTGPRQ